ncbi:MAG TPA: calcium-binding protein [Dongiaceae bacterium]|nr:calcium-binding protein [Dongiaceae bacterium]
MAIVTVSSPLGVDFDDLSFPELATGKASVHTATTWRVSYSASEYDEYKGIGLTYDNTAGDFVPIGGTITSVRYVFGGVTQIQATGLSVLASTFRPFFDGDNFAGMLEVALAGNDTITGGKGDDRLLGFDGNDTIDGKAGNDTMEGGTGNDIYIVDKAGDTVVEDAGKGTDTIRSSIAIDLGGASFAGQEIENVVLTATGAANVTGNALNNTITGGAGVNILQGLEGDDVLNGLGGNDSLQGGDNNDTLDGGAGNDTLEGGLGDDTYIVDSKGDVINDVDGEDTLQSKLSIVLSASIEHAILTGTGAANATGNGGDNKLTGNDGVNKLDGGAGADTMSGGKGADTYVVDDAGDVVTESLAGVPGGKDLVQSSVDFELGNNVESLTLTGLLDIDGKGNAVANLITGNDGNNRLDGQGGNDTLNGGKGNDTYVVDSVADKIGETLTLAKGGGTDTVESSVTFSLAALANVENLTLTGDANINGTGNAAANAITGNDGNNKLDGGAGVDTLAGGAGDDIYVADSNDVVIEDADSGSDSVLLTNLIANKTYGLATDLQNIEHVTLLGKLAGHLTGTDVGNNLTGNDTANKLNGGLGNDHLVGLAGNDTLNGGEGDDLLNGGVGNDVVEFAVGDGEDTIVAGSLNTGDVIKLLGTDLYDLNFDWFGDGHLYIAQAINGDYNFGDTGFIRLANFFGGTGSVQVQIDAEFNDSYGTDTELSTITFQRGLTGTNNVATSEIIAGQDGNDKINGNGGYYDGLFGGGGNDTITGGSNGFDNIRGGGGNDIINALGGDDRLRGDYGNDTLNGGAGFDTADYRNSDFGVVVNLALGMALDDGNGTEQGKGGADTLISIEDVRGSQHGDSLAGDDSGNILIGLDGDDTLTGAGGDDFLDLAGDGVDTLRFNAFGDGDDTVFDWDVSEDQLAFASALDKGAAGILDDLQDAVSSVTEVGDDVVVSFDNGSSLTFRQLAGAGVFDSIDDLFASTNQAITFDDKTVLGTVGNDSLAGGDADDLLRGLGGNDTLNGGKGNDILDGGLGNDVYEFDVDGGEDTIAAGTYNTGDVIKLLGADHYDLNYQEWDGSLYIAGAVDGDFNFDDTGFIKLTNFYSGTGSINVQIDTQNYNEFYGTDSVVATFTFQRGLVGTNNANNTEVIIGTNGNDKITGNGGFYDSLWGANGNDTITGGAGFEWIRAGSGNDVLNGAAGNDTLRGDSGNDTLNGGTGNDRADYRFSEAGVLVNLATGVALDNEGDAFFGVDKLISMEDVRGSEHDDVIIGSAVANNLQGRDGADIFTGAGGDDTLNGGGGADTFQFNAFGEGKDIIEEWNGSEDRLAFAAVLDKGAPGILDDLLLATTVVDQGNGNDVVVTFTANGSTVTFVGAGTGAIDSIDDLVADPNTQIVAFADKTVTGGAGKDTLTGTDGHDVVSGLAGNDTLTGGEGNDILDGGLGNDTYIFNEGDGFDVIAAGTYNTGDVIKIEGADFYDLNYGWTNGNLEIAPAIDGDYDFNDTGVITVANFFGGTGSIKVQIDTLNYNLDYGTDPALATFTFQRGLIGTNNATSSEVIIGTAGNDKITGNGGFYDALYGEEGNDTITAGTGGDFLRGGDGNDLLNGGGGDDRLRGDWGNDTLNGGDGNDRADYRRADGNVSVDLALGIASNDGHGTIDTLISIENVRGGDFDDELTGNSGTNDLEGRAGFDILTGAGGDDVLSGGGDSDHFRFNSFDEGHDVIEDWNGSEDVLAFKNILDTGSDGILDDLLAAITDVIEDGGDVIVSFASGSTLTFQGAATGTVDEITDLVTNAGTQIVTF